MFKTTTQFFHVSIHFKFLTFKKLFRIHPKTTKIKIRPQSGRPSTRPSHFTAFPTRFNPPSFASLGVETAFGLAFTGADSVAASSACNGGSQKWWQLGRVQPLVSLEQGRLFNPLFFWGGRLTSHETCENEGPEFKKFNQSRNVKENISFSSVFGGVDEAVYPRSWQNPDNALSAGLTARNRSTFWIVVQSLLGATLIVFWFFHLKWVDLNRKETNPWPTKSFNKTKTLVSNKNHQPVKTWWLLNFPYVWNLQPGNFGKKKTILRDFWSKTRVAWEDIHSGGGASCVTQPKEATFGRIKSHWKSHWWVDQLGP